MRRRETGQPGPRQRFRRRGLLLTALLIGTLLPLAPGTGPGPVSAEPVTSIESVAGVALPPALGQAEVQVFVPATGHSVSGVILDYWRATGGVAGYGNPISEPFAAENGYLSQAFEGGILQYLPEVLWTVEPIVRPMPISPVTLSSRVDTPRADGRRGSGGGDRRAATWQPAGSAGTGIDSRYVEATGHTIAGPFLAWYQRHEGAFYLGNPLSEPMPERGAIVQWFERGVLMQDETGVRLAPVIAEHAERLGIETAPVAGDGLPVYDESLFLTTANPFPVGDLSAPGPKRIEVSLSRQTLWAYQGETMIAQAFVSTGLEPNTTEIGQFRVRYKVPLEDMRGATDAEGNVIWVAGDDGDPPPGSIPYGVEDVPTVLYFNMDAEALHGAYWHNNFGYPMSHGCVNLPVELAEFLYGWAPLGTPVLVSE